MSHIMHITGIGVMVPTGIGTQAFFEFLQSDSVETRPVNEKRVPNFETREYLGKRGSRDLDRASGLFIAACDQALKQAQLNERYEQDDIGLVAGTSIGSGQSIVDFVHDIYTQEKPYFVNPSHFPNVTLNCLAGREAIWHKLKGFNTTVAGGPLAGLHGLRYANRALQQTYAKTVLVAASEELNTLTDSLVDKVGEQASEAAIAFSLEKDEPTNAVYRIASVLGSELSCLPHKNDQVIAERLQQQIEKLLASANIDANDIACIYTRGLELNEGVSPEALALEKIFNCSEKSRCINRTFGETYSVSFALQVTALIAELQDKKGAQYGLVTSLSAEREVGCALIHVPEKTGFEEKQA